MDLEKLKTFCVMAKTQNFTKAAEELFCSQPSVTKQIQAIEEFVGTKLFDRVGKKVYLNDRGKIFYEYAKIVLDLTKEYLLKISQIENLSMGMLSFGTSGLIGTYVLPPILKEFHTLYPNIEINIDINFYDTILERIQSNILEFAFISEPKELIRDKVITYRPFLEEEMVLILPVFHKFSQKDEVSLEELQGETLLISNPHSATRSFLEKKLKELNIKFRRVIEMGNIEAVKQGVEAGLGISIVSATAIKKEISTGLLVQVPFSGIKIKRRLFFVQKKNRSLSPTSREFIKIFQKFYTIEE